MGSYQTVELVEKMINFHVSYRLRLARARGNGALFCVLFVFISLSLTPHDGGRLVCATRSPPRIRGTPPLRRSFGTSAVTDLVYIPA